MANLELPASSSAAFRRNLEPKAALWYGGLAPFQRIFRSPSCKLRPCQPHYGPEVFAWTLRALLGVLKASSGAAGPRFGASSGRNREEELTLGTKQPETNRTQFENMNIRESCRTMPRCFLAEQRGIGKPSTRMCNCPFDCHFFSNHQPCFTGLFSRQMYVAMCHPCGGSLVEATSSE